MRAIILLLQQIFFACTMGAFVVHAQQMKRMASYLSADSVFQFSISQEKKKGPTVVNKRYFSYDNFSLVSQEGVRGTTYLCGDFSNRSLKTNKLYEQGQFYEGLKDGEWRSWYPSGKLKRIENWRRGERRGASISYSEDGTVLAEGVYRKDGSFKPAKPPKTKPDKNIDPVKMDSHKSL